MQPTINEYVVVRPSKGAGKRPYLAIKAFGKQLRQATFDSEEAADLFEVALVKAQNDGVPD